MIAFKDEFLRFRDVNSRTVISFDLIFKKCPVCGRERQIYDPDEYLLKIRRPGKPTLYFDRESCKRKYLALHPEVKEVPAIYIPGEHCANNKQRVKERRAVKAKKYYELWKQGLKYREIAAKCGVSLPTVQRVLTLYLQDIKETATVF